MKKSEFLLNLLYPPFCALCGEILPLDRADEALCEACRGRWEEAKGKHCPECGRREDECGCTMPALKRLSVECAHLTAYRDQSGMVERMLLTVKDERYEGIFRFLGSALAERSEALFPPLEEDAVATWLPRSSARAHESGVDQAKELAKAFAICQNLPCEGLFDRVKGGAQKELTAEERLRHARASYRLKDKHIPLTRKTVVVVDDILTTGASMLAAAELLRSAGAARIVCLTAAKTRTGKEKRNKR